MESAAEQKYALIERYFEDTDAEYGQRGLYRLTPANQALADEIYVSPAYRLAELESKPVSSMRYRTVSNATDLNSLNQKFWLLLKLKRSILRVTKDGHEVDYKHNEEIVSSVTLQGSCSAIKHIFLDVLGYTYFVYDCTLYPQQCANTTPISLSDLQDYSELVGILINS